MNVTKRKFNALLNGIGNKSTTSFDKEVNNSEVDVDLSTINDAQSKKQRISNPMRVSNSISSSLINTARATIMNHKKSASMAHPVAPTEPPKYAPWDREEFLKRLKSFSNITEWTPKPERVNEVEWAKRGWVCQKRERVRCCLCNVEILVKLNKKVVDGKEVDVLVADNIEAALADKYVELIITSHDESCLWRKRGCDDTIFKLPLNHAPTTIEALSKRYQELLQRSEHLPYLFNMRPPPELDLELVLSYLPPAFFSHPPSTGNTSSAPADINKVAFLMALGGWQGYVHERLGDQPASASCHACFRVLGFWIFKSKELNGAGEEVRGAAMNCLDIRKQHRNYCPWSNPASQNGQNPAKSSTSTMAGWEIVVRILKNDHYLRTSKDAQAGKPRPSPKAVVASEAAPAEIDDEDAKSIRDEKDKERWAKLRRVKSLFDTKKRGRSNTAGKPAGA
ncbi:hypothetical protein LZ554_001451 [Drepanopeziza brunnea f. sp. 'monogermtubi']|nr:hypothetical protein LZ554_001451 [Drepanopeziza brunnea f. sp. 'monogermtubi']